MKRILLCGLVAALIFPVTLAFSWDDFMFNLFAANSKAALIACTTVAFDAAGAFWTFAPTDRHFASRMSRRVRPFFIALFAAGLFIFEWHLILRKTHPEAMVAWGKLLEAALPVLAATWFSVHIALLIVSDSARASRVR